EFPYHVTGILADSGTAADRIILTPIESVWQVHAAEEALHSAMTSRDRSAPSDESSDGDTAETAAAAPAASPGWLFAPKPVQSEREVTAVMLQLTAVGLRLWMKDEIDSESNSMAAIPINEMLRLYRQV